ncbi:MAG TPA: DUF503 domain-containing protein [Thermoanaerobaculia bacterium]|nr:DUF503 domain-containing protein [Thermoanaerobaculia bacterium]
MRSGLLVGLSRFELHLPHARSLKDKRRVVKGMVDRLHERYRVSVLESGFHDLHQRAEVAVAYLAGSESELDRMAAELRRIVDDQFEAVVSQWDDDVMETFE